MMDPCKHNYYGDCPECDSKVVTVSEISYTIGGCHHPNKKEVKAHFCAGCGQFVIEVPEDL